jgi:hypothetical protein
MASNTTQNARRAFNEIAASTSPAALEQFRLERPFELRAVISALRLERSPGAWHEAYGRDPRSRQ